MTPDDECRRHAADALAFAALWRNAGSHLTGQFAKPVLALQIARYEVIVKDGTTWVHAPGTHGPGLGST